MRISRARPRTLIAPFVIFSLTLAACGGGTATTGSTAGTTLAPTSAPSGVAETAPPAPSFAVTTPAASTAATAAASSAVAADACSTLVTEAEIEQAIAAPVDPVELNGKSDVRIGIPPYGGSLCHYRITAGGFVQVVVGAGPDATTLKTAFDAVKAADGGVDTPGLGDAAFTSDNGLVVIQGTRLVVVTVFSTTLTTDASDAAQVAIAKKVLARW